MVVVLEVVAEDLVADAPEDLVAGRAQVERASAELVSTAVRGTSIAEG